MPIPLTESIGLVKSIRDENTDAVAHLNDQELAELAYSQTQDERLLPAARSSTLMRGINTVGQTFKQAGQGVESAIADEKSPFLQRLAGRVTGNLVGSIPELAAGVGAASMKGVPSFLTALAGGSYVYGKNKAETNDTTAAAGATVGYLLGLKGGIKGAQLGEKLVGEGAGKVAKAVGGTIGGAVGQVPGDYVGQITQPGEDFALSEFLKDPLNLPAYLAGQPVTGAALHAAQKLAGLRKQSAETTKAATPDLDSQQQLSDADRLVQLTKKPLMERTELDNEEMRQISRRLGKKDEEVLAGKAPEPETLDVAQEPESAIRSQLYLLNRGKKAVVELQPGQPVPQVRAPSDGIKYSTDYIEGYMTHDSPVNGKTYFYDERKTSPEQIDNAIKTKSLGHLLGYGVPDVPSNPNGELAVLRGPKGQEKVSVLLSEETKPQVMKALGEMALGDDSVNIERPEQVMEWRKKNSGLKKLYSIAADQSSTSQKEVSFINHVLNMFSASTEVKQRGTRFKGPRFQMDAEGNIGGKGLLQAVKDWSPTELWEHYKSQGIETLLGNHKVNAGEFGRWIRENTPEVEVKKLTPHDSGNQMDREVFQHQLETLGYEIKFDPTEQRDFLYNRGQLVDTNQLPPEHNRLWNNYNLKGQGVRSDAATGRYGVEPKELRDMPGAVDILVRVPQRKFSSLEEALKNGTVSDVSRRTGSGIIYEKAPLYRGPHFGDSDVNVLASIRGYMETLPNGEKVFHVFEVQSDWGQARKKAEEPGRYAVPDRGAVNHPLLAHYETLALKTAIQHARSEGATKVAISDAETAMMTEGHDRTSMADAVTGDYIGIRQEPGMRAAYDQRLPAIMKKLTGDGGRRVEFGRNKNAEGGDFLGADTTQKGSPVFKESNGEPKTEITARLYDVTNPKPEVHRLFSIYDADKQASLEANAKLELDKLDTGLRDPGELTPQQFLERAVAGDRRVEMDALTNFLAAVRGKRGALRFGSFLSGEVSASMNIPTRDIKFNKDLTFSVNEAFTKLAHELTHGAILDMAPETYAALKQNVTDLGQPARLSILTELGKQFKMGERGKKFDAEYLSGARFDPADPHYADRVAHEFGAGLMEIAAEAHFQKNSTSEWMKWMPVSVQKLIKSVIAKLQNYFSPEMPSVSAMLEEGQAKRLSDVVSSLQKDANTAEQANLHSLLKLHESGTFDESRFLNQLVDSRENFKNLPRGGDGQLYSLAGDIYKGVAQPIKDRFENLLLPALWRARTKPETAGHFWALHNFRPSNISDTHGYLSFLGQTPENSLSREQAIERYAKFQDGTLNNTGARGEQFRNALASIQEENQNRREASQQPLTDADLVQPAEMKSEYGMTDEQAEYARRIVKVSEVVAKESMRKARQVDTTNLTRMFYAANKTQDIEGVRAKVQRINRITEDAGHKRFELESREEQLKKLRARQEPDLDAEAVVQQEIQQLQVQDENFKRLLDNVIRQEFAGAIPIKTDGPDPFVSRMSEFMMGLSARRAQVEIMTGSAGWASMTRRGRFRLRVYNESELGDELATVKEYKGFHSEKEMNDYLAEQQIPENRYEKFDMNELKDRVKAFTPNRVKRAQEMAYAQFDEAIKQVSDKAAGLDPAQQKAYVDAISDIKSSFNPLEQEMKDVISVKGDKFGQRRYNVAGYNKNDFLPNTFEYMQYKTVASNKAVAEAESNLHMSRKELENQPELRDRMKKEQQYVLTSQKEWGAAKKVVFYYYLGASFRHIVQNSVQIPLNGVSQMVAEGTGMGASYKHFGKAAYLASEYARKGTTGDATVDMLLKQANKDGVSFSTALEAPVHESVELQNILDSINAHADGHVGFGEKVKLAGTRLVKNMEQFLQATSVAAESANRKTTFIASILADRAKGITDQSQLYTKASQFTNFVNFIGDKPNRPGYMIEHGNTPIHAPLGLLTALQSFTINHISQLYSFYERGIKQGHVADKKAFAVGLAHLLAFSGSMGMVGAATAEQLFEQLTGVSLKTALREKMVDTFGEDNELAADRVSDTVLGGFPALLGVDSSNSIGLGSPFFRYQAGSPITAEQFGGPAVGMAGRVATAVGKVTEDPFNPQAWWDALRSGAPSFLTHAIRGYDMLNSGASLDKNQQPIGDPLTAKDSISTVLGFTPQEVSKQRDLSSRIYKETKKSTDDYERNVLRISQLINSAQQTGDQTMIQRAQDSMDSYIASVGGLQDRDAMVSSITDQLEQDRGRVTPKASLKESATRQRLEKSFPSLKPHYSSSVDTALDELEVAQLLGLDDVMARKLKALPAGLQHKALADALMASGLRPEEVEQFLQPDKLAHLGPR